MKRLQCLDGLRGFLAVYVLVAHMAPFAPLPGWVLSVVSHGGAAVDMFFILSGLVIAMSLERYGDQAGPFLIARVARIFPVFLPVFAIAVLVQPLPCGFNAMPWVDPENPARIICHTGWPHAWGPEIAAHLTMTHGLFPNAVLPDVWVSFLGPAWSLTTEWQFYVLAVLLAGRRGSLIQVLMALAVAGVAWHWLAPEAAQFSRAFLPNKAHYFALGVASEMLVRRQSGALPSYGLVLIMTLALCVMQQPLGKLLPPLAWTLCLAVQTHPQVPGLRQVNGLLQNRVAQFLGAISYCLYLVNELIHKVVAWVLSGPVNGDGVLFTILWLPLAILLPIGVAAGLHVWVEAPALRRGRAMAQAAMDGGGD
jgi:peptidoglycan/LPS O-acetylase OafA/YrhL